MKKLAWILAILVLHVSASATQAQADLPSVLGPANPVHSDTSRAIDVWVTNTEEHLVHVAEAMPESKYSFSPTAGEFKASKSSAAEQYL